MRDYLVEMRKERSMTQQNVADAVGITRQYYAMIENGDRQPKMEILLAERIAKAFGVDLSVVIDKERDLQATLHDE